MAYSVKETQIEHCCIPCNSRGGYIRVARVIPENKSSQQSIDIREMYTAEGTDEIRFSSRGVRVKQDFFEDVISAILGSLTDEEYASVMEKMASNRKSVEQG